MWMFCIELVETIWAIGLVHSIRNQVDHLSYYIVFSIPYKFFMYIDLLCVCISSHAHLTSIQSKMITLSFDVPRIWMYLYMSSAEFSYEIMFVCGNMMEYHLCTIIHLHGTSRSSVTSVANICPHLIQVHGRKGHLCSKSTWTGMSFTWSKYMYKKIKHMVKPWL